MFKSWRNDKKKIKAIFRLQFQATKVPQLKKPALIISLVPEDVGKRTFKLEKAPIQNGTCLWEKPLFITVKLVKQPKTGNLKEKIYHFIVSSSGSSKSGYLGEASIDFADFAEETEPITVSLPLKFANSGAVLDVTVQRVQAGTNQRYGEHSGDSLPQDGSLRNRSSNANSNSFYEDTNLDIFSSHNAYQDGSFRTCVNSDGGEVLNRLRAENMDVKIQLEEIRQELSHEKELNNNLKLQLEKTRESNSKLILAVNDLDEMLEQKKLEISRLSVKLELSRTFDEVRDKRCKCNTLEDKDQQAAPGLEELSESSDSIIQLESQVKALEIELEKQAQSFHKDLDAMMCAKVEQEQRAIRAEEALRKTTWKNAATTERLQEEFKSLPLEMAGKLDENEKLMTKAITEADELRIQNKILEHRFQNANAELSLLRNHIRVEVEELSTKLALKTKHVEQMSAELEVLSQQLKCARKNQGERQETSLVETQVLKAKIEEMLKKENDIIMAAEKAVDLTPYKRDDLNPTELLIEMSRLKERNKAMESELKEMQERYSEISLKFAEVEGERQQLVMTVRNLKSGKRK